MKDTKNDMKIKINDGFDEKFEQNVSLAASIIANSNHLVAFTGAGISTESGLPDFRGPDGVWTRRDKGLPPPNSPRWCDVSPNSGHYALVKLQNLGILKFLISQNVDNLHIKSGIKEELLAEFHGNMTLMRCLKCDKKYPKDKIWDEKKWGLGYRTEREVPGQPKCTCGGRIVSSIVNFGDPIPEKELKLSYYHSSKADVFLVVGSSLTVMPAAEMPKVALAHGSKLIIVNKQETPYDNYAHIRFFESAGKVLSAIVSKVEEIVKRNC
ncbi:MAG: Sir2 family NAD-dependent protein deacetylase [Thermoplasmata archaeon]